MATRRIPLTGWGLIRKIDGAEALEDFRAKALAEAENLMTAESRVSDVDAATEMAAMTRNQVLAQAGVSMLAQANMMPQMALSLLR